MAQEIDLTERLTYFGLPSSSQSLRDLYSGGARGSSLSQNHVSPAYGNASYPVVAFDTGSGARPDISLRDFDSAPSLFGKSYTPYVNDANTIPSTDMRITTGSRGGVDVNGINRQGDGRLFGYSQGTTLYSSSNTIGSILQNNLPGGKTLYELLWIPVYKNGSLSTQMELRLRIVGNWSNIDSRFKNLFMSALQWPRVDATFDGYSSSTGTTQWRWFSNNSGTGWHNPFRIPGGNLYSPAYPCWSTTK